MGWLRDRNGFNLSQGVSAHCLRKYNRQAQVKEVVEDREKDYKLHIRSFVVYSYISSLENK